GEQRLNEFITDFVDPELLAEMDLISEETMEAAIEEEAEFQDDPDDEADDDERRATNNMNAGPDPEQVIQFFDELDKTNERFRKLYDRYGSNGKKVNEVKD